MNPDDTQPDSCTANSPSYKDAEALRCLYWDEGLTGVEIADRFGVHSSTIYRWMDRHGIERRDRLDEIKKARRVEYATFGHTENGYERWSTADTEGNHDHFRVHRLLAIAEYGPEAVGGNVVHHENGIPWDNRPCNIEVMGRGEHSALHHGQQERAGLEKNSDSGSRGADPGNGGRR
ncbi:MULTISPECIES: HNH endonuclease [Halolamina]|uniref:HNH endonuclease n=1 Tax=Halolamina TaxID=1075397 RepID=UPI000943D0CC|nr:MULTISPECIES: HNH endonuclease [Halolamina]NHX37186.1 hypothetical protein [Halolamina sp. R1-12]